SFFSSLRRVKKDHYVFVRQSCLDAYEDSLRSEKVLFISISYLVCSDRQALGCLPHLDSQAITIVRQYHLMSRRPLVFVLTPIRDAAIKAPSFYGGAYLSERGPFPARCRAAWSVGCLSGHRRTEA